MKKTASIILLVCAVAVLLFGIYAGISGVISIKTELDRLAASNASGADYLGIGWGLGIIMFYVSCLGLVLSVIGAKISENERVQYVFYILTTLFVFILFFAILVGFGL